MGCSTPCMCYGFYEVPIYPRKSGMPFVIQDSGLKARVFPLMEIEVPWGARAKSLL